MAGVILSILGSSQIQIEPTLTAEIVCNYISVDYDYFVDHTLIIPECHDRTLKVDCKNDYDIQNMTGCFIIYSRCNDVEKIVYRERVVKQETICEKEIHYGEEILKFEKDKKNCVIAINSKTSKQSIVCDGKEDGNGDGICQSGETCYTYELTNKIEDVKSK